MYYVTSDIMMIYMGIYVLDVTNTSFETLHHISITQTATDFYNYSFPEAITIIS